MTKSILKNKEEWGGFRLSDYNYVANCIQEMKKTIVKEKFAQVLIKIEDEITIDGVKIYPDKIDLELKTEFVYPMGQVPKPRKKHKKLTIEWSEPCESNPVHTVPPPPPPPYHNIGEPQKLNTVKGFETLTSAFSSMQKIQSGLIKDDYSFLNKLLKKAFAPWIGGYQPIVKEDQQPAPPPKSK